jgi:serine/threonine-protein phosphatase PGAM5
MKTDGRQRYLHFVRHGQYVEHPGVFGGVLTETGRAQAFCLGRSLDKLSFDYVHLSDMNRAIETTEILSKFLPGVPLKQDPVLREMIPTRVPNFRVSQARLQDARERLDKIEKEFLRRTNRLRHELIVCHGNLIRCLVARQLGTPRRAWLSMDIHHCGITTFRVGFDHRVRLVRFNDIGHLSPELILQA